jgi:hypothetical protein
MGRAIMEWTCRCGAFAAEVDTRRGTRAVCYCPLCRAFAEKTDAADVLDAAGGSDLFQVAPEEMTITRGADRLAWTKLTEKGPARWVTTCCNTPVANTMDRPGIPFITLQTHRFSDPDSLGPVTVRVFRRHATAPAPEGGASTPALYWEFAKRALRSRLTGGWKRNPLFDKAGRPAGQRIELG